MSKAAQNSQLFSGPEWDSSEASRFPRLALRYQEIAAEAGIKLYPFRSPDMPLFSKASPELRKTATDFLETIVSIHEETIAASEAPVNTPQLLWRALRRYSLVPGADIFSIISKDDITIIYDENQRAIFWSLHFFKVSSLSVEEMFFGVWYEFTRRAPEIQAKLYEMAVNIITGKITGTFTPDVPPHEVQEIGTLECIKTIMEIPTVSVLTNDGKFAGMLIVQNMTVIE